MSEYKRFITYIYGYEKNEKGKNAGFVRIEIRDDKTKLQAVLKNIISREPITGNVLAVLPGKVRYQFMTLGKLVLNGNSGECIVTTSTSDFMGTGIPIADVLAVAIFLGEKEDLFLSMLEPDSVLPEKVVTDWGNRWKGDDEEVIEVETQVEEPVIPVLSENQEIE